MKDGPRSILIVKLSAIGDVVHTLPLLEVLRQNLPYSRIDWLVEEEASQILEGHEALNRILVSRRKSWQRRFFSGREMRTVIREVRQFLKELRSCRYDLVIDLQGLFKSGILTGISEGKRKIGFTGGREGSAIFLTEHPYFFDYNLHALDRYLKVSEYLNCTGNSWRGTIPLRDSHRIKIDKIMDEKGLESARLVAINPIARWKTKLWKEDRFALLAERLQRELPCQIIFTGSREDRSALDRIVLMTKGNAMNLAGETKLKELAYLYSRCRVMISTDTGPMHIAAAMGCPVVALFGPTAPRRTGPYGDGHKVIVEEMDCAPCFKKRCDHVTCMDKITVEKVFDTVKASFFSIP